MRQGRAPKTAAVTNLAVIGHFKSRYKLTRATKILNIIYGLTVVFFLLDSLTSFDIKSQGIKSFIYFGLLIGTPLTLVWNYLLIKTKPQRIIGTIFPVIILTLILIIGPIRIFFSTSAWRTQTVLYQNAHLSFKTVEFQMQDVGALGYNRRTVEVLYLTNYFMVISEVPNKVDLRYEYEWIKVDKDVNELGLK